MRMRFCQIVLFPSCFLQDKRYRTIHNLYIFQHSQVDIKTFLIRFHTDGLPRAAIIARRTATAVLFLFNFDHL